MVRDVRIALGGVAPKPWRARVAESALRGAPATLASIRDAATAELAAAQPLPGNAFMVRLVRNTMIATLHELVEDESVTAPRSSWAPCDAVTSTLNPISRAAGKATRLSSVGVRSVRPGERMDDPLPHAGWIGRRESSAGSTHAASQVSSWSGCGSPHRGSAWKHTANCWRASPVAG